MGPRPVSTPLHRDAIGAKDGSAAFRAAEKTFTGIFCRTLKIISKSGHELVVQHVQYALISAGRTQGPLSADLINGTGADATILFNAHIPDAGSHRVYNAKRELIAYSAVVNLYHELAHAMHMMKGTWRYFASDRQAVEEENMFRRDLARMQGTSPEERVGKAGMCIDTPE